MLEKIRTLATTRFAQVILALIAIPFALWGVESYIRTSGGQEVIASVADEKVTVYEFEQALRQQQERMRSMLGKNYDPQFADNPQVRSSVLDELVNQHLIFAAAAKSGLAVSDTRLAEAIIGDPAFQENGKFSQTRYDAILRNQGYSQAGFEALMARDLQRNQFQDSVLRTAFAGSVPTGLLLRALEQTRDVSIINLAPEQYMAAVKLEPGAARKYYDDKKSEFTVPEQVRVEYVELSLDALAAQTPVTADELKQSYQDNLSRYVQKEERKASHILIAAAAKATDAEKKAARDKAQAIYESVKKNPAGFAGEAKKSSQDPGSAQQGGDLGFFGRGSMVKPFEDAAFALKKGDITGPVQSDFGYHIIRLTDIHPEKGKSFAEASIEIEAELKKQKAGKRFAEIAQIFSDKVFEQSTALKPIADELKLALRTSGWFARAGGIPPFNNPKLAQSVFSEDVLKNKRNTEAVEIAPNVLVAARLLEYKAAELRPFESIEQEIARRLAREEAGKLAKKDGEARLKVSREGKGAETWPADLPVSRQNAGALPPQVMERVLKADSSKLPAYEGLDNPQGGYTLVRVSKVNDAPVVDDTKMKSYTQRLEQTLGQQEMQSLLAGIRKDAGVKIKKELIEKKAN